MKPTRRLLWAAGVAVVLGAACLAYLQPAVMVQLSEQIWACFG
ncbi:MULTISPECIES: hypothetical protein [Roseateles]|nr:MULTISPECIES: hypothetical protein [unclassified Roseateles]HEV6965808.1 hypothetical protein [Roseateles sp.]